MTQLARQIVRPVFVFAILVLLVLSACTTRTRNYETPVPPTPQPTLADALSSAADRMGALTSLSFTLTGEGAPLLPGLEAQKVVGKLTAPDQVTFEVTDSDGVALDVQARSLPLNVSGLGVTVSGLAKGIQDPTEAENQWIDNRPHRGISGTVSGSLVARLITSAAPDSTALLTLYLSEDGLVRRIRIEGPLAPGEPPESVRVLDLTDLR
jgi:hypothetical protein